MNFIDWTWTINAYRFAIFGCVVLFNVLKFEFDLLCYCQCFCLFVCFLVFIILIGIFLTLAGDKQLLRLQYLYEMNFVVYREAFANSISHLLYNL